jgi:hypothetical protein
MKTYAFIFKKIIDNKDIDNPEKEIPVSIIEVSYSMVKNVSTMFSSSFVTGNQRTFVDGIISWAPNQNLIGSTVRNLEIFPAFGDFIEDHENIQEACKANVFMFI